MASISDEGASPVVRMIAMQGSSNEDSYAHNSSSQNHNFHSVAKPRLANALKHVVRNIIRTRGASQKAITVDTGSNGLLTRQRPHIAIADLGCSHGRNTLDCAEFVLHTLQQNWHSSGVDAIDMRNRRNEDDMETQNRHSTDDEDDKEMCDAIDMRNRRNEDDMETQNRHSTDDEDDKEMCDDDLEIQYFFSDLPSNDFNALFQSLQPYLYQNNGFRRTGKDHLALPRIFAAGVPGSFYSRLFPSSSLHLVICSYSLHWISQVPPSVFDRSSLAWNGGRTWLNKAKASVVHAYAQQSKLDMKSFLKCRAHELAKGGIMFLFIPSRAPERDCLSSHLDFIPLGSTLELLDFAFREMVDEGTLTLEEMEMFNMPLYFFDQEEFESMIMEVPNLDVLHIETMENMAFFQEQKDKMHVVQQWMGMISSVMRPLLEAHVGKYKADEVFKRVKSIAIQLDCFNTTVTHNLVIASLQRRL